MHFPLSAPQNGAMQHWKDTESPGKKWVSLHTSVDYKGPKHLQVPLKSLFYKCLPLWITLKSSSVASLTAPGTHSAGTTLRAVQVTLVTWLAQQPTLVLGCERLQAVACLPSCRNQWRVDWCCCLKRLESHRTSFPGKCCLFWTEEKMNQPCISMETFQIKNPKQQTPLW